MTIRHKIDAPDEASGVELSRLAETYGPRETELAGGTQNTQETLTV
jgi:hypothetical protein